MKRNIQLLSNRFINDNKPCIAQSREVRLITNKVAAMIRDKGSLIRITHEQCPFCNGDKVTVIAQKDRYGLPMDTQICETCELVFSSKYFSADFVEDYYANYADKFKSLNQSPKEMFERRTAPKAYTWIRQNYIKEYLGNNYKKLQIVIEVGCNDGCNLYPYHLDGKKVVGCDFDEQRMETGRAAGLTILSGGIDVLFHEAQANHMLAVMEESLKSRGAKLLAKVLDDITTYHTTLLEAAEIANKANVKKLFFYHLTPAPRNYIQEIMFTRGVDEVRKDWTLVDDGTLVVLPVGSDKVVVTNM